jgi:rhamnopyranosyl-N-acetylglucosaminyl-diphospho-decaprenol beta-1,3/1,4-galactofuranosyltransferase
MTPPPGETVCALVVTYNRKDLLRECLTSVLGQTRAPDHVVVFDNASTDGTREMVRDEFPSAQVVAMPTNEGSSGGFHEGIKWVVANGYGWIWMMDDDTIPATDALGRLLDARERMDGLPEPLLLASKVLWTDGNVHPMNPPGTSLLDMDVYLNAIERGLLPLRWNTFPSLLVKREAVERHGLPRKHFFIWGDDLDFTARILRHEPGYLVLDSVAEHRTPTPHKPSEGGERFYYAIRNALFTMRGPALRPKERVGHFLLTAEQTRQYLANNGFRPKAILVVLRGVRDGLLRRAV